MMASGLAFLLLTLLQSLCVPSTTERLLPEVIGPATGSDPVWMVDGSDGHFEGGATKTLWIFKTRAPVRVRGHELASGAEARFRHQGPDGPIGAEMVIEDPRRESVLPGGATRDVLDVYAFIPTYVFYPRRGCYRFEAEIDGSIRSITVNIK